MPERDGTKGESNPQDQSSDRVWPAVHGYFIEAPRRSRSEGLTVTDLLARVRKYWLLLLLLTTIGGICGAVVYFVSTPVYRASVTIAPANAGDSNLGGGALNQLGGLASLAGIQLGGQGNHTELALSYLRSDAFTKKFIEENDLLPVLFPSDWDAGKAEWSTDEPPTIQEAIEKFDRRVRRVSKVPESSLYTVSITMRNRMLATSLANRLVDRINLNMRMLAIQDAENNVVYLAKELAETPYLEVKQSIFDMMETHIKSKALASSRQEYAFRVIDPAMVPDEDGHIRPKLIPLIAIGLVLGVLIASGIIAFRSVVHE